MAQWTRIHLPMQGTQVQSLVQEDSTCLWSNWAHELQLLSLCATYWSPHTLEPMLCNKRGHCNGKPTPSESSPCSLCKKWEAHALQLRAVPARCANRTPAKKQWRANTVKNDTFFKGFFKKEYKVNRIQAQNCRYSMILIMKQYLQKMRRRYFQVLTYGWKN